MSKQFIHIPKNGGTTIVRSPQLKGKVVKTNKRHHISTDYSDRLWRTMKNDGEHHGNAHARWRDLLDVVRKNRRCFAIVRNPWSRTVSRYLYSEKLHERGNVRVPQSFSFEEFLEQRHEFGGREFYWHRAIKGWFPQKDYVTDADGNLKCDVLRLEHLNEDVSGYFNLQFSDRPWNVSNVDKMDYRSLYTDTTKQIVAEWYAEDIEFFGFTFDGPATKNIWNS